MDLSYNMCDIVQFLFKDSIIVITTGILKINACIKPGVRIGIKIKVRVLAPAKYAVSLKTASEIRFRQRLLYRNSLW